MSRADRPQLGWHQRIGMWLLMQWPPRDGFQSNYPPWAGHWQEAPAKALDFHDMIAYKVMRQVGKTKFLRAAAAATVALGYTVIIASPSLAQTGRVLIDEVHEELLTYGPLFNVYPKKKEGLYSRWKTPYGEGKVFGLSLSGDAKVEGYTGGLLIVDEAQDVEVEAWEKLSFAITQAMRSGHMRIIFTGIGSLHPSSLLSQSWRRMGARLIHFKPEEIVAENASYADVVARLRAMSTAAAARRNIDCEDMEAGLHQLFPLIEEWVEYEREAANVARRIYFGCDVGRFSDETVVTAVERVWDRRNVVDILRIGGEPFHVQAEMIRDFVAKVPGQWGGFAIETNGLGVGLYDRLREEDIHGRSMVPLVQGVALTAPLKNQLIARAERLFEYGLLGVREEAARVELGGLQREFKGVDENKAEVTHSDVLSALIQSLAAGG